MAFSEEAREYANGVLAQRREKYALLSDKKKAELFEAVPDLKKMELRKKELQILRIKCTIEKETSKVKELDREIARINEDIRRLLLSLGLSEDCLEEKHYCMLCSDTGYRKNGEYCSCYLSLIGKYERNQVKKVSPLSLSTFDNFSLDYYSKDNDKEMGISPYENMKQNLKDCRNFVESFPEGKNILMMGSAGLGKTHLALAIAESLIKNGADVIYCSCSNIFSTIEKEKSSFDRNSETLGRLKNCSLLVLDDLGSEYLTNFTKAVIYDVINTRLSNGKSTIVTTNLMEEKQLMLRYDEKVSSRLVGCYEILPFFGNDVRKLRNGL